MLQGQRHSLQACTSDRNVNKWSTHACMMAHNKGCMLMHKPTQQQQTMRPPSLVQSWNPMHHALLARRNTRKVGWCASQHSSSKQSGSQAEGSKTQPAGHTCELHVAPGLGPPGVWLCLAPDVLNLRIHQRTMSASNSTRTTALVYPGCSNTQMPH